MQRYIFISSLFLTLLFAREIPSDSKIQGRLNIINGSSAECMMHRFYTQSGWIQVEGEIGRNGIDGLYYKQKNGIIKEVLVSESKWNTSKLGRSGKNKSVKQMSKEWILRTMNKLIKKMSTSTYVTLKKMIEHNQYRARLFRVKPISENQIVIIIHKIKNKGLKAFEKIKQTELSPISLDNPKNSFERNMIRAYNACRNRGLHKYLGFLYEDEVSILLKDNYIQKVDVTGLVKR